MRIRPLCALAGVIVVALPVTLLADDGPLNPPAGPIASTPGPEPRRELSLTNTPGDADSFFKITASGSYYLPRAFGFVIGEINGKSGIEVDADNVTIDLNGFTFRAINNGLHAIRINPGRARVTIRNGHIANWGRGGITGEGASSVIIEGLTFNTIGIANPPGAPAIVVNSGSIIRDVSITAVGDGATPQPGVITSNNCILERIAVTASTAGGIVAGSACELRDCTAWALAGAGIVAGNGSGVSGSSASLCSAEGISVGENGRVANCAANDNTGNGIAVGFAGTILDSTARGNDGHGFVSADFGLVSRCVARLNSLNGIDCASGGGQVIQCTAAQNSQNGIRASADTSVIGCTSDNHFAGAGILAVLSDARIEGNTCTDNLRGIDVDAPGCIIIRNVCAGNTTNFDIVASNIVGVIVNGPLSPAIVGSAGGAGVGTTDPWGNVSY